VTATHPFTRAGLGAAPFRCVAVRTNWHVMPGFGQKPGGCCAFCSTGILYEYVIKSSDGREFVVGSDCVRRTGAEVTGFREQRLQLAREKREKHRQETRAVREARWALQRIERGNEFRRNPENKELIAWLDSVPLDEPEERFNFRLQMKNAMDQWGSLTDGQRTAAINTMNRERERARQLANSIHVGTIGEKIEGEFLITKVASWDSNFGWPRKMTYLTVMTKGDNIFVYKGNHLADRGMTIRKAFTIKDHTERDGAKQTVLWRPRNIQ
jgi:hypothetical protein